MKTFPDFRSQPPLFTCFHGHPMDAHLDRKTTVPTTWFLSEITENNNHALDKSCTDTTKTIKKNIEKQV